MAVDAHPGVETVMDHVLAERRGVAGPGRPRARPLTSTARDTRFRRALVAADGLGVLAAFAVTIGVGHLRPAALALAGFAVLVAKTTGLYDRDQQTVRKATLDEAPALFQLATLLTLVAWLVHGVVADARLDELHAIGLWALVFANLVLCRTAARRIAKAATPPERVMVVGEPDVHARLGEKLALDPRLHARVVAYLPLLERRTGAVSFVPQQALESLIAAHGVHRVIVAPDGADLRTTQQVVSHAKALGVNVSVLPRICEVVGSSVQFDELGGMTLLGIRPFGLSRSSLWLKRAVDVAGAAIALLAAAPVMAAAALAVRRDGGPILFRQTRVGRDGEHFEILKFRTMVVGADAARAELAPRSNGDGLFKVQDDPRVTRPGRLLRRVSLDELPQLWNVLRGEMSLVGPRPLVLDEDMRIEGHHRRRLHLKPGVTGPWQVLGSGDARVGLAEMVTIDYLYAANWSLWADVRVVLRTVAHVFGGRGV